ncbi:MAG: DNA-processing protein DprA [bacterium]|nr:DNA-processing protein DprA [bacterium]
MIRKLTKEEFPPQLLHIPDPPKDLWLDGNLPPIDTKILCVIGARKHTQYGKDVCEKLINSLRGKNISIVSGLALGIDSIAHMAAINAGLHTLAVPGSGIGRDVLYPSTNRRCADTILESGGGLLSEFPPDFVSTPWAFPKRNRIMAALSHAVLIIEAEQKSGTLITSRLATDYNRDVLVVPGSIFSKNSEGPHLLLRIGATPITSVKDLHEVLGFETLFDTSYKEERYHDCSGKEKEILHILQDPQPRDELIRTLGIPTFEANILLSLLEMKGHIKESLGLLRIT